MAINSKTLGLRLRAYREQLQESVEEVSKATGLSASRLAGMESGDIRPNGDEILILADHWNCDFQSLLSDEAGAALQRHRNLIPQTRQ